MKTKRMCYIPLLLGCLLTSCSCVTTHKSGNKVNVDNDSNKGFYVEVDKNASQLKLYTDSDFKKPESKLVIDQRPKFTGVFSYQWFLNSSRGYSFDKLNSEETDYKIGFSNDSNGFSFFKYTFFVKNVGESNVEYNMSVELENKNSNEQINYVEYLRLMVFEGETTPTIYAHRSKSRFDATNEIYKEYVCGPVGTVNYYGEAELFESDTVLVSLDRSMNAQESKMITLLFWLEGGDNECKDLPEYAYFDAKVNFFC